ncbi:MAG: molybdopterin molybdotransferase MoeA [Bacteroidetes bacterium]|nr:molybdopterin molybdotransferase MoeA [Bacteroidota bacterium]
MSAANFDTFISVADARRRISEAVSPLGAEVVQLADAVGRVLAEDVSSAEAIPPFDNSAMDGYAIPALDVASGDVSLRLIGEVPCGVEPDVRVEPGTCVRIMTGARIPDGADAVIQQELVQVDNGSTVRFEAPVPAGANIRKAGSNISIGQRVIEKGTTILPGHVAVLASIGRATVPATRRPRVAVFSSGDELVAVDAVPGPSQIRNSNGPALTAQTVRAGGTVVLSDVIRDNEESVRSNIQSALTRQVDVLVVSGGASVGDYDIVRQVMETMGLEVSFWKVRQRPGKPLAFGLLDGAAVFMLPGNPVSASICFHEYVRPALIRMMGNNLPAPELIAAVFEGSVVKNRPLHYFVRGSAGVDEKGTVRVRVAGQQGSHVSMSLAEANCLIHLPEETDAPSAGDVVSIEWLRW